MIESRDNSEPMRTDKGREGRFFLKKKLLMGLAVALSL
jgi:hypothetical protein